MQHYFMNSLEQQLSNRKTSAGKRMEKLEPLHAASQNAVQTYCTTQQFDSPEKQKHVHKRCVWEYSKKQKQPRCPLTSK